jgi:hypothetical protein
MLFAIITVVGLIAFFYLIFKSLPRVLSHVLDTFTGLIPNLQRVFGQLSPNNFKTLSKEKKYFAIGEVIIQILCLIGLIFIFKVGF